MKNSNSDTTFKWLVFIHSLSPASGSSRVRIWRKLKQLGMVSFRNSVYFLPYTEEHLEICQWLCQEIKKAGGEVTLLKVHKVENMSDDEVAALFNKVRDEDYTALVDSAEAWLEKVGKLSPPSRVYGGKDSGDGEPVPVPDALHPLADELRTLEKRLAAIGEIDFFNAPEKKKAEEIITSCRRAIHGYYERREAGKDKAHDVLDPEEYRGKKWVTRPRPYVDRIATAWAISRFVDPGASFEFAADFKKVKGAIPFDYLETDFSHQGEDCTLETLIKRFGIDDKALSTVAEVVHDADLKDSKYGRKEAKGLETVLKGLAAVTPDDHDLLKLGIGIYDALYAGFGGKVAFLQRPDTKKIVSTKV